IGQARAALVEDDQTREGGEPLEEARQRRLLPRQLDVRHPARDEDEIQRPFADDLVGDVDVAAAGEAGLRSHEASLLLVALRVSAPHGAIASGFRGSRRARLARNRNGQLGVAYYRR